MNVTCNMCRWSTFISGGNFEAVPSYVMSQRGLRPRAFLIMPVKDAPRIEDLLSLL